jgi:putative ATP-dependent DNA ligase
MEKLINVDADSYPMAKIDVELVSAALKKGKADRPTSDLAYIRFREEFRGIGRGTVIADDRIIWGYPHIRRIFTLEKGILRNIGEGETLYAEEKIDGFNVRIASIGNKAYAFSRGGYLDLFVTEKARDAGVERFFRDYPDHVLCGEMLGNTPYTKPSEGGDAILYIFDIDRGDGSFVPCQERYDIVRRYGLEGVPRLGKFGSSDIAGLKKAILAVNKGRKEGMVLKTADRGKAVKYVSPWSDIDDIAGNSRLLFDMPIGFFYQRCLRSAFFIDDFSLDEKAYSEKLGKAFYRGLIGAIRIARAGGEIDEEFEISFRDKRIWDDIRRHMSRDVKVEVLWMRDEGKKTRMRFRKIYKKTNRTLRSYAEGKGITD